MRCLLEVHLRRQPRQHLELAFKGWRKVVELGRPEPRAVSHQPPCHPNDPAANHAPWPTADARPGGAGGGVTCAATSRSGSMVGAAAVTGLTRAGLKASAGGGGGRPASLLASQSVHSRSGSPVGQVVGALRLRSFDHTCTCLRYFAGQAPLAACLSPARHSRASVRRTCASSDDAHARPHPTPPALAPHTSRGNA